MADGDLMVYKIRDKMHAQIWMWVEHSQHQTSACWVPIEEGYKRHFASCEYAFKLSRTLKPSWVVVETIARGLRRSRNSQKTTT